MIEYSDVQKDNNVNDGFTQMLREASEYFANKRIQMMGEGFKEIISEQSLFDEYVNKLTEGLNSDEAVQTAQILENARTQILSESTVGGIQPVASIAMPTVRKMWSRVAMKHVYPTEAVKKPKFTIPYMEPYIIDENGNKKELPKSLRENNDLAEKTALNLGALSVPVEDYDILAQSSASTLLGDGVDPDFQLAQVTMQVTLESDGTTTEDIVAELDRDLDAGSTSNMFVPVEVEDSEGTVHEDKLFLNIDLASGMLNANSLKGLITTIEVEGYLESTNNSKQESVSFDIKRKDVTIGTGAHINAPIPVEFLQDTMALYNIDGASTVIDLMSKTVGMKLEHELIDFFDESFQRTKSAGNAYEAEFDVLPPSGYSHGPKDWREELKLVIDYMANKMKRDWNFYQGEFVLFGNPIDTALINNVSWTFSNLEGERGGVDVDFNLGAYAGSNKYRIVSSNEIEQGKLRMMFIPKTPQQMTYKYYPYTFTVEKGTYNNPQQTLVPNVMMTKRHTVEELKPICGTINILNHDGSTRSA
jgi:hypothetical protein